MSKKKWSKEDLTVVYYFSKWGLTGLDVTEEELVESVLDTTHYSFNSQTANFRFLLNLDGHKLEHASKAMITLIEETKNLTMTQVRNIVIDIINKERLEDRPTVAEKDAKSHNDKIAKLAEEKNQKSRTRFADHIKKLNLRKLD
jgi:hypothetical protein